MRIIPNHWASACVCFCYTCSSCQLLLSYLAFTFWTHAPFAFSFRRREPLSSEDWQKKKKYLQCDTESLTDYTIWTQNTRKWKSRVLYQGEKKNGSSTPTGSHSSLQRPSTMKQKHISKAIASHTQPTSPLPHHWCPQVLPALPLPSALRLPVVVSMLESCMDPFWKGALQDQEWLQAELRTDASNKQN
jgi:hypothetical protein